MNESDADASHLDHCPLCGIGIISVKTPGIIDPWGKERLSLMVNPCTCVVPIELFRNARHWLDVVSHNNRIGIKSGIEIRLESSGEGLGTPGEFDQVVMYDSTRPPRDEVFRYDLDEVYRPEAAHAD